MKSRDGHWDGWTLGLLAVMAAGCSTGERGADDIDDTRPFADAHTLAASPRARSMVDGLRERFRWAERTAIRGELGPPAQSAPVLRPSEAARIDIDDGSLRPRFPASRRGLHRASVALPLRADGAFRIVESSGMTAEVALVGATDARAESADGFVVYRQAYGDGVDMVHRPTEEGTEDFLSFERAPAEEELRYELVLGEQTAGLRLVANTLELLDAKGSPRLRMAPPYVVDSRGEAHAATTSVYGCAVDTDPRLPWGRAVTPPALDTRGCEVRIAWKGQGVRYPALVDPAWSATGSMSIPRAGHIAAVLPNGYVLAATGGTPGSGNTAELYNPNDGTWAATGSLDVGYIYAIAFVLSTGQVLVAEDGTARVYDVAAGMWSPTGPLTNSAQFRAGCLLAGDRAFLTGGSPPGPQTILAATQLYDPATNTWSAAAPMKVARKGHSASVLADGRVLVAGGAGLASAELYDPASNQWTLTGSMSGERRHHVAAVLPSGKVLVAGGEGSATAELFDPATGLWGSAGIMSDGRDYHAASLLSTGMVLVTGGDSAAVAIASADLYDPSTNAWNPAPAMANARYQHTASVLSDGSVLAAGGINGAIQLSSVERFNDLGMACAQPSECLGGLCVDGVCCNSACGGGVATDCQACSIAAGAEKDGVCGPATGSACDDGDLCTESDTCQAGVCSGLACAAEDECHEGTCDPQKGCDKTAKPDGTPCVIGVCVDGTCGPKPAASSSSGAGGGGEGGGGEGGAGGGKDAGDGCDGCSASAAAPTGGFAAMLALSLLLLRRRR